MAEEQKGKYKYRKVIGKQKNARQDVIQMFKIKSHLNH